MKNTISPRFSKVFLTLLVVVLAGSAIFIGVNAQMLLTTDSPDPSLVGWWKFDGNGNNEVTGSPAAVTVGNALYKPTGGKFDGYAYVPSVEDYLKIPYSSMFDLPNSLTVEFWFRQRSNQDFNQSLVYKGNPINDYNFNIFRYLWNQYNNGPVIAGSTAVGSGYWSQVSNNNEPPHNVWHYVAYTRTNNGAAYYIDGALIHSTDFTQGYGSEYAGPVRTPAVDILIAHPAPDTDIDNLKIYNRALSHGEVLQDGGFPQPPLPGAGAPEPSNDEPGVWAQVDVTSGQVLSSAICTRAVCGANGEYHGYVPPATFPTGSVWWPTSKRYIWQLPGQAGYGSGSFDFNTYIFAVSGGTIYNGVFTPTPAPIAGTTTTPGITPPVVTPTLPNVPTQGGGDSQNTTVPSGQSNQGGSSTPVVCVPIVTTQAPTVLSDRQKKQIGRIINRQILEGQLLIKSSTGAIKKIGVDVGNLLDEMNADITKMQSAAKAIETNLVYADDALDFIQENVFDAIDDMRTVSDNIRTLGNVRQFVTKTSADIKLYDKNIRQLQKSGGLSMETVNLLAKLRSDFALFRPLASKRLKQETVDVTIASIQAISDESDQLKYELGLDTTDTLVQQLKNMIPAK